jgi:hypothetical protein
VSILAQTTFPIYVVLAHLAHLFDAMGSNNTSKNIKNMRKAGFSDWTIVLYYQVRPLWPLSVSGVSQ